MPKNASIMFKMLGNACLYYTVRKNNGAMNKTN